MKMPIVSDDAKDQPHVGSRGKQGSSMVSEYSFSPKHKQHHHLVIHSGLSIKADQENEDARTEEEVVIKEVKKVPSNRMDHQQEPVAHKKLTAERDPLELVTLESMIVRMSANDKVTIFYLLN